jgi:hypothetical protein
VSVRNQNRNGESSGDNRTGLLLFIVIIISSPSSRLSGWCCCCCRIVCFRAEKRCNGVVGFHVSRYTLLIVDVAVATLPIYVQTFLFSFFLFLLCFFLVCEFLCGWLCGFNPIPLFMP